jgi:hypothetical protein
MTDTPPRRVFLAEDLDFPLVPMKTAEAPMRLVEPGRVIPEAVGHSCFLNYFLDIRI